jgi:hypothetical protein
MLIMAILVMIVLLSAVGGVVVFLSESAWKARSIDRSR